jgi:hypothetical protein
MIPARRDWQRRSKNLTSLLAEFLFLPAPFAQQIRLCFGLFVLLRTYRRRLVAWRGQLSENFALSVWENGGDFLGTKAAVD